MKTNRLQHLRSAAMVVGLALIILTLFSSAALAEAPAPEVPVYESPTPDAFTVEVFVPAGTPTAISSIYIGPDLGGAVNIGSAISAAIDVTIVEETEDPVVTTVVPSTDVPSEDDLPISIPENTPTSMSSISIEPWVEESTTTETVTTETSVTETSAPGTVVSTGGATGGAGKGSSSGASRPKSGGSKSGAVSTSSGGVTGLVVSTSAAAETTSSVTTTTGTVVVAAAGVGTSSPTIVAAISSLPLPEIAGAGENDSAGVNPGIWILVALAAVLTVGLSAAAITRRLRSS